MNFLKVRFLTIFFSEISRISTVSVDKWDQDTSGQTTPSHHCDNISDISLYPHDHASPSHSDKTCDNHQDENRGTDAICPETK